MKLQVATRRGWGVFTPLKGGVGGSFDLISKAEFIFQLSGNWLNNLTLIPQLPRLRLL